MRSGDNSNKIRDTLELLNLSSPATLEVFAEKTRDIAPLTVYRDRMSGVIFIDDFYTGDGTYSDGAYRQETLVRAGSRDYEVKTDTARRSAAYDQFYIGKDIADFGCGDGAFLQAVMENTTSCVGIELQDDYVRSLRGQGIDCVHSLDEIEDNTLDAVFSLHVLEHLPDPLNLLGSIKNKLKQGGHIVVEVPHARDFLLTQVSCEPFKEFTLWSQHLLLHTRESLGRMIEYSGFGDVTIEGVQRYPLSNHLNWLANARPGGHKTKLSSIDTRELTASYEAALQKIDATDTLVAIARKV